MGSNSVLPKSLVPNKRTNRLASEIIKYACDKGVLDAPFSTVIGIPRGEIECVPDWDPDVLMSAPVGVADRLNVELDTNRV
jgi:hypothetical protein